MNRRTLTRIALLFLAVVLATALLPQIGFAQRRPSPSNAAGTPFQYLIEAANQIKQVEYSKAVLSLDDNGRIARIACDALTRLVEDPNFKAALSDILSPKNLASFQSPAFALVEDLSEFNAVFLPAELENLHRFGLEYPAIFDSLQIASRERIRANLKEVSAVAVMGNVQTAKSVVCNLAAGIVAERQRNIVRWTYGGVILIVADTVGAIGFAPTGVAGAIALTSIGVGATATISGAKGDVP